MEALEIRGIWGSDLDLELSAVKAEHAKVMELQGRMADAEQALQQALEISQATYSEAVKKNENKRSHRAPALSLAERWEQVYAELRPCCRLGSIGVFYRQLGQQKMRPQPTKAFTEGKVEIVDFYSKAEPMLVV